jgi:hypothetical protein
MHPSVLNPNCEPTAEQVQLAVLERIENSIVNELAELEHASTKRPVNAVAWVSRNLVELTIWAEYCMESPTNAQRFHDDAARDTIEMLKVPNGLFNEDPEFSFQEERKRLLAMAHEKGIDGLDDTPAATRKAAETIGKDVDFRWANKFLSKFAHPTALWVITPYEELETFRQTLYDAGFINGNGALKRIKAFNTACAVKF